MDQWTRVRIVFGKRGRLRFLGQLDLGRTLERALRISGLPIRFTEGYNPRVRMSFPCASPTAMASSCELVEVQVLAPATAADVTARLGEKLPEGLPLLGAEEVPEGERLRLDAAEYEARPRDGGPPLPDAAAAEALLGRESVPVTRRGKPVDLRPLLREIRGGDGILRVRIGFRDSGATARPEDVMAALGADPVAYAYERTGMRVLLRRPGGAEEERRYGA
jgi:radical SAM-linked protein